MKTVPMKIEHMGNAFEALNDALQNAMTLMMQKAATEATIGITINLDMPSMDGRPQIKYKTSVKVPVDVRSLGTVTNVAQLYWDQDTRQWMVRLDGEQIRMEA